MFGINWIVYAAGLCYLNVVSAQFPYFGECPNVSVQENFDTTQFMGKWYEIERTVSFLELAEKCVSATFTPTEYKDGTIEVLNEGRGPIFNLHEKVRLIATIPDLDEPAKMQLRINDMSMNGNYWILKTDYTNYALVWSCNHIWWTRKKARTENLWILSRERTLPEETKEDLVKFLTENNVKSRKFLRRVKQTGCN